jgi:SAM-dependent methyltransferase
MCHAECLEFGRSVITRGEVEGKDLLEVGARDVNGSLRTFIESFGPRSYLGVDIEPGPGVDEVCDANDLVDRYGSERFDGVLCTEVLEHVRDWPLVCSNLKRVVRPGGFLLVTTRSKGFHYHAYPYDLWRYEVDDARVIFGDLTIERLEPDPGPPGIFLKARRPSPFTERDLSGHQLFSMVKNRRCHAVSDADLRWFKMQFGLRRTLRGVLPAGMKKAIKTALGETG